MVFCFHSWFWGVYSRFPLEFSAVCDVVLVLGRGGKNIGGWLKFDKVPRKPLPPDRITSELLDHSGP